MESFSSGSDFSDTRKKLIRRRQHRAKQGYVMTDTEEDDNDDDEELADQVDPDPGMAPNNDTYPFQE